MPSRQGGEALARYLLANHLGYLIYDYGYFAPSDREARIALRSHQQYARTRLHLYNDGNIYILDLATPANGSNPAPNPVNSSNNP